MAKRTSRAEKPVGARRRGSALKSGAVTATARGASGSAARTPLTRERILRAALMLADGDGIDALSMRNVAQSLGVEAMSLYNHVASKDDLIDGMLDLVIGEIELPKAVKTDGWKRALRGRALSAHTVLMRHPWAPILILSRVTVGPANLRYTEATLGCLLQAGFTYAQADHAWNALDAHIHGFTLQKLNFPFDPAEFAAAAQAYLPMIPADTYPHMHAMSKEVAAGRHAGVLEFTFGLDLILDGLERLLAKRRR
jgi:AcrR family transcriptional regulator